MVAVCLAVALAGVGVGAARLPDGHPRIEVLDVGQGDAILVTGSHGGRALVDGGPDPDRLVAALDARVAPWDRRIDLVVVSHPHDDHVAGLAGLFGRYEIRRALGNGAAGSGPGWRAWTEGLASRGIREGVVATGDVLHVDDVVLAVLWPDRATVSTRPSGDGRAVNDASVVLLGTAQGVRFLLPGDAEDDVDPTLASRGLPHVSVYKVAHHGSRTASSDALLGAIDAAIAVISVGSGNTYGHPSPATLARLAAHRAAVLRTDERGTIAVTFDRGRASVAAERPSASSALRYHRRDDRPWARRVREASPLPRPAAVVPPARARGGGGRSVARAAHVRRGHDRRRPPHRGGRAPP